MPPPMSSSSNPGAIQWLKVDAASGKTSPLFDADKMETALASLPGVTRTEARSHRSFQ